MKTAWAIPLTIGFAILATGCKPEQVTGDMLDPAGVYALVEVDGMSIPAKVSHGSATLEVRSGTFTIEKDGTCSSVVVFIAPSGKEIPREVSATYEQEGSELTMSWEGAGTTVGVVDGNTFTMINEGMSFVYRR